MNVKGFIVCTAMALAVATAEDVAAQSLAFDRTRIEAGEISEDDSPVYEYVCTNMGADPVRINRLSTTCGTCLKAEAAKNVLNPGDSAIIRVAYFPKGHPGKFERRIFVYTDSTKPEAVLELAVTVRMGSDLSPYFPVDMGKIRMKAAELNFRKGRNDGLALQYLDMTGNNFKPQFISEFLPPYIKVSIMDPLAFAADEDAAGMQESMKGRVGAIYVSFDADAFPEDAPSADVPLILKGLGLPPSSSTINIYIK